MRGEQRARAKPDTPTTPATASQKASSDLLTSVLRDGLTEGKRNDTLFRIACEQMRNGLPQDAVLSMIRAVNAKCTPPFEDNELDDIVESAWRYDESGFDGISRALGLPSPITGVHKVGIVKSEWRISLEDGRQIFVPSTAAMYQLSTVRACVADATQHSIPLMKANHWHQIASTLIQQAQQVQDEDGSEEMLEWLVALLSRLNTYVYCDRRLPEENYGLAKWLAVEHFGNIAFDTEGRIYVRLSSGLMTNLWQMAVRPAFKSQKELGRRLRDSLGFEPERIRAQLTVEGLTERAEVLVWVSPPGMLKVLESMHGRIQVSPPVIESTDDGLRVELSGNRPARPSLRPTAWETAGASYKTAVANRKLALEEEEELAAASEINDGLVPDKILRIRGRSTG